MVTRRKLLSCTAAASLTAGEAAFGMWAIDPANATESADLELLTLADRQEQLLQTLDNRALSEGEESDLCDEAAWIAHKAAAIPAKTALGVVAKLTIGAASDEAERLVASSAVYDRVEGSAVLDARKLLFGGKAVRS